MIGVGLLAGIGFTMSIFIALLSFKNEINFQDEAKFAILIASVIAAVTGFLVLNLSSKNNEIIEEEDD
jgi:NhaA family Na+:H+ antiporter